MFFFSPIFKRICFFFSFSFLGLSMISTDLENNLGTGCTSSEEGEMSDANYASPSHLLINASAAVASSSQPNSSTDNSHLSTASSQLSETVISSASSASNTQLDNLSANSSYSSSSAAGSGAGGVTGGSGGSGGGLLATAVPPITTADRNNVERSASFIGTKCKIDIPD